MIKIKNVCLREFKLRLMNGERLRNLSHIICKSPTFQNLKIILFHGFISQLITKPCVYTLEK